MRPPTVPCPPREHVWVRTEETKPYPHNRKLEYARVVSTCGTCGQSSASGWARRLKWTK